MARESIIQHFVKIDFIFNLEQIGDLHSLLEGHLREKAESFAAWADKEMETMPEHVPDDIYAEDYWQLKEGYPNILRASFIVSIYSLIESSLNKICNLYAAERSITLHVSDLRGSGMERAKEYIKKVLLIDFPDSMPEWAKIKKFYLLRNTIVHNQRIVSEDNRILREFIKEQRGIRLDDQKIIIDKELVEDFLSITQTFMNNMFERLPAEI